MDKELEFKLHTLAEFTAINTVMITLLQDYAKRHPLGAHQALKAFSEIGYAGIDATGFWGVPQERLSALIENAKSRFDNILASAAKGLPDAG